MKTTSKQLSLSTPSRHCTTSRRKLLARRRSSVRCAQPLESKLKHFADSVACFYAETIKSHQRMKVFDGHEVISLDEVKRVAAKDVLTKGPPAMKCQVHTKSLKIFCFDCNLLICRDCTVKDHRDHDLSSTMWSLQRRGES